MSTITISPNASGAGFLASQDGESFTGRTYGEALDGLSTSIGRTTGRTLVILDPFQPDEFFNASQMARLDELMSLQRAAQKRGEQLPEPLRHELQELVRVELVASGERAKQMAAAIRQ
jgi:hypothetical protein